MLTSGQCVVAAYLTDGGVICPSCADKRVGVNYDDTLEHLCSEWEDEHKGESVPWRVEMDLRDKAEEEVRSAQEEEDLRPLIQYELDSDEGFQESGCYCDDCGEELVEPTPVEEEEDDAEADEDTDTE